MKKITAILLIAIAVVSCKKETQTVTKLDPATGKTITVEVPADSVQQVAEQPAIKDSLGIYTQSFKLAKGKTYPLLTVQHDEQSLTAPNGETQSGKSEATDEMSFTVNDFKEGIYDITINLISKKSSQTANGKSIVVDTKAAAPKEEQLKMMWNVNKALVGNKLQMKMKANGDVLSITGFEPIYAKVAASAGSAIKKSEEKKAFANSFKNSFNESVIKEQFMKNLKLIPAKGAKIGESWTETENASGDGKVKLTTKYTLKSAGNGIVEIGVSGGIPKKSDKQTQEQMSRTISSELTQNGTITLDQNTGWIKTQKINVKTAQTETLSDGKQSQSMKSVSNSTVSINP